MSRFRNLYSKTLLSYLWQEFLCRYRFKYILPRVTETVLDGVRLDLSHLSLKVRNRILMGIYEAHEKRMCLQYLDSNDAVLEIGSAIGFIGLFCQKNIGIKKYFMFEANPNTLAILRSNYRLNGLTPFASNLALAPGDGSVELDIASDFWENSVIPGAGSNGATRETVTVSGASFQSLLHKAGEEVNVLIIDVEGAEQFIDPDQVPPQIDKIIMEIHPHVLGPRKTYDLIAGLVRKGFHVAAEEQDTFTFLRWERVPAAPSRPDLQIAGHSSRLAAPTAS